MKNLSIVIGFFLLSLSFQVIAQTATNFTEDDCEGNSHTLFEELDEGKIIVIEWVMPCGSCSYFGGTAYDAVQSFSESHPGLVEFYLTDDYANTSCSSISSWGNTNNMENHTAFSSSAINMSDYGTDGMPKVVVLAGSTHQVYYNENNGSISENGVTEAINTAINSVAINELGKTLKTLNTYPNPSKGTISVEFTIEDNTNSSLDVFTVLGEKLSSINLVNYNSNEEIKIDLDLSGQAKGMYLIYLNDSENKQSKMITLE